MQSWGDMFNLRYVQFNRPTGHVGRIHESLETKEVELLNGS